MPYTPKTWENKPSTASPINATNLNHMEGGIKTNDDNITDAQNAILTLQGEMLQAQGDISALETLVDSTFPVDTESGNPAVITDAFGGAVKGLSVTFTPKQSGSGTPSPSNVMPISGRTEANVVRTGKNTWNDTDSMLQRMSRNGAIYTNTETDTKTAFNARVELMLSNSPTYASTVATISSVGRYSIVVDTTNITYDHFRLKHNGSVRDLIISLSFSIKGQLIISFDVDGYNPSVVGGLVIKNIQLEVGSTATTYEPYNGETYTIDLDGTRYGFNLNLKTGGATIPVNGIVLNGSENWQYSQQDTTAWFYYYPVPVAKNGMVADVISSHFKSANNQENSIWRAYSQIHIRPDATIAPSGQTAAGLAEFKAWLANNPVTIVYPLATPITVQLTPEEVTLLKGDNVLTTDADSIEASYSADIALYIAKKIAEGSQGNRSLSKGGSGDEEVKEEVKEEEKREEIEIKEAEPLTKEVR